MEDLRVPVLPYNEQDDWGCEKKPTNVSVVVLENEYLRAVRMTHILNFFCKPVSTMSHRNMRTSAQSGAEVASLLRNRDDTDGVR